MTKRNDDHFELDAHALAMIAAYRREEALPTDVRERVWDRVESDVASSAPTGVGAVKWTVVLLAAAAAIAAVAIGAQVLVPREAAPLPQQAPYEHAGEREGGDVEHPAHHVERERSSAAATREAAGVREPIAAPPVETAVPGPIASPPAEATTAEPRLSKPRTRRPARDDASTVPAVEPEPEATTPADTLAEETRMLERARKALSASRPIVALAILDDYQRRFPAARLAPERNALRAIALCDAGRSDEGSKAADAFLAGHSGHALASRVRRACDR